MDTRRLTAELKQEAARLGFDLSGACPAVPPPRGGHFLEWLESGCAGQMHYLDRRKDAYQHPGNVLDGARSLLVLAMNYRTADPQPAEPGQGRVSCYAWGGADYHDVIHERLRAICQFLLQRVPTAKARGVVDTAPLLEREFAQLAGLGWVGKNTMLLNQRLGSWFFLAAILTDQQLEYDMPHKTDHCGTCRACLDACPTQAFAEPYVLDATRCISYLTIELRDWPIPPPLRDGLGEWVYGCDICQQVCPWNHGAPASREPEFEPVEDRNPLELASLFSLCDEAFRARFRKTPLWRPRRRGLLRNAAIALGNDPSPAALPALVRGLNDAEPLVRGACAWALGRYGGSHAARALRERLTVEIDEEVRGEIEASLV